MCAPLIFISNNVGRRGQPTEVLLEYAVPYKRSFEFRYHYVGADAYIRPL